MKIRKIEKIKFEDAVKYFNFTQFYEICKIFNVDVVDKDEFKKLAAEAREQGVAMDMSKVKMRRDFDNMTNELIEVYNNLPRRNRRQIDPIIAKIVWGNKRANEIGTDRIEQVYTTAASQVDNISELIKNQSLSEVSEDDEVVLDEEINVDNVQNNIECSTVMAATASGDGE